jgi:hypothetical protein
MAATFGFIIGTNIRRDVPRKQEEENLQEQAQSDGRYVAAHIDGHLAQLPATHSLDRLTHETARPANIVE